MPKKLVFDRARIMLSYIAKVIWKELVVALGYYNCCLLNKMNASISHHFNQQCIGPSVVLNAKTKSDDGDFHLRPWKRKRMRSAGSGASTIVGGIATNKITTFLVEAEAEARKRKRH